MKSWRDKAIQTILVGAASTSILIVLLIFFFLGREAFPFIWEPGFSNLFQARWIPVSFKEEVFGLLPLVTGSLLVTGLATVLMVPFGVFGAIY
ncbi:MAG: phosphate ABC transporter permease subunit PstC, partial [Candidatus Marinimicrobia bacterium]|nr:phosphate ABC transporter permease subunit PstC [Candidatus Neomarinimicrobiota bacterium]